MAILRLFNMFIVTSPLVDFCTRELYRLLAGLKIDSALEILPSVRASHAEIVVRHRVFAEQGIQSAEDCRIQLKSRSQISVLVG